MGKLSRKIHGTKSDASLTGSVLMQRTSIKFQKVIRIDKISRDNLRMLRIFLMKF